MPRCPTRRRLRFWGWGYEDEDLSPEEVARIRASAARAIGHAPDEIPPPVESDFDLPAPRAAAPKGLAPLVSATPYDRLTHALGKSFGDVVRMRMRRIDHAPDLVAFPKTSEDVARLLDWASSANLAVVPFGGGSSVAGGIEPDVGNFYAGSLVIDVQHMNRVVEIDRTSRAARIRLARSGPRSRSSSARTGSRCATSRRASRSRRWAAGSPRAVGGTSPRSTRTSTTSLNRQRR